LAQRSLLVLALLAGLCAASPVLAMNVVDLTPPTSGHDPDRFSPKDSDPTPESAPIESASGDDSTSEDYEAPTLQTRHFGLQLQLSCRVSGDGELELVNESTEPLPPGTRIKWQFRQDRVTGFFAITGPLGVGRRMVASGILGDRTPGGQCSARVI
jgi:hypothetical protein